MLLLKHTTPALLCALCASVAFTLGGCDRQDTIKPPVVRYGEDECAVCRMIVNDDRYAAALITLDQRGRYESLVFDDIGCIFEYEAANPDALILARYVRHQSGSEWLDASEAEFVHSRDIHTPMAFGLAALASLDEARAVQGEAGGDLITLGEARRRFQEGTLHVSALDGGDFNTALTSEHTITLDDGGELRLSLAVPQILPPGRHDFDVIVERRDSGSAWAPAANVTLQVEPEMPSMGHGSPGNEDPSHRGEGFFRGLVHFTMAGPWLVHVDVQEDERPLGRASFAFEVKR